jgi:Ni/Fe-hydrogenase subunit HybB-like protein
MTILATHKLSTTGKIVLGVLALLTLLGVGVGIYRLAVGLGESTNLTDAYPWGLWIAFDFSLIAFAGVGFTMAAVVYILNLDQYRPLARAAVLTGLLGYICVLVILLIDLGRPDRFWGFIVFWNAHSPLFEISWCVLLYTTVLALEFLPILFERLNRPNIVKAIHSITIPIVIAGVVLSTLHQSTLGTLYMALPFKTDQLWFSTILWILFYLTSIATGLSVMIFVWILASKAFGRKVEVDLLGGLAKGAMWVLGVYLILRFGDLWISRDLRAVFAFDLQSIWFWVEILLGVVLPIILYSQASVRKSVNGLLGSSALVILGVFIYRFNATLTAQAVNRFTVAAVTETASYSPSWMEYAIQIGVLAAATLAWYYAARLLPILPETVKETH